MHTKATLVLAFFGASLHANAASVWEFPNFSDRVQISLTNHHSAPFDGIVALNLALLKRTAPGFPGTLLLAAEDTQPAQALETQLDHDEFLVAVHLNANETQPISFYYSNALHDQLPIVPRVYASHAYGYNRATGAIESERMGYRTYGGFFFDVQAHSKDQLGLINSLLGYSSISHPPREGEDIIHLGDTLGVGGIFLRTSSDVYRPALSTPDYTHRTPKSDEPSYKVIESGSLRAVVEESLPHWTIGPDTVAVRARYEMDANQEIVHCHWWITPTSISRTYEIGAGILILSNENNTDADEIITTTGIQEKSVGRIAVGMSYAHTGAKHAVTLETPGGKNEIVIFPKKLAKGGEVSGEYTFAASWAGSGWPDPAVHLRDILAQQSEPPTATILAHETSPTPKALEAEPK